MRQLVVVGLVSQAFFVLESNTSNEVNDDRNANITIAFANDDVLIMVERDSRVVERDSRVVIESVSVSS